MHLPSRTPLNALQTAAAVLALSAGLGLAGCSAAAPSGTGGASPARSTAAPSTAADTAAHNDADVAFAQMMVPHHEQAVAMSDTVLATPGVDPEVSALAEQIKAAQAPEVATMQGWLTAWGEDLGGGMGDMGGMDHGAGDDGMATDDQLAALEQADGPAAQRLYLQLMTAHHTGAITMAQTEIADGEYADAVRLAETIVTSQQQELGTLQELLATR